MKIPFCTFCIKTRVFCSRCQELLDSQQYDMTDIDVLDAILNVKSKFEDYLKDVEYIKSYDVGNLVVIVLKGIKSISRTVLKQFEQALEQTLNKKVKIIEKSGNINELATQLAFPARILTVVMSWLPDGTNETVVKIPRSEVRRLPLKIDDFARILSLITGLNVRIEISR